MILNVSRMEYAGLIAEGRNGYSWNSVGFDTALQKMVGQDVWAKMREQFPYRSVRMVVHDSMRGRKRLVE